MPLFEEKLVAALQSRAKRPFAFRLLKWRGIEFPPSVKVGPGLQLPHGAVGLVVHENVTLGARVKLFQGVTLGRGDQYLTADQVAPGGGIVVEDDVLIGAGAVVLFRGGQTVRIGAGSVIGANSVVTADVPARQIWAGTPARLVRDRP